MALNPPATLHLNHRRRRNKKSRTGKKAVARYFSPELSPALNILRIEQDKSLQAPLDEALDDLLRKYGKHPFGERQDIAIPSLPEQRSESLSGLATGDNHMISLREHPTTATLMDGSTVHEPWQRDLARRQALARERSALTKST